ncbi:MAG: hypothetical protein MPJ08_08230 [Nitrosopumilus sp.]|nr:hypothetical protein [Nitrosopumilus sp.]
MSNLDVKLQVYAVYVLAVLITMIMGIFSEVVALTNMDTCIYVCALMCPDVSPEEAYDILSKNTCGIKDMYTHLYDIWIISILFVIAYNIYCIIEKMLGSNIRPTILNIVISAGCIISWVVVWGAGAIPLKHSQLSLPIILGALVIINTLTNSKHERRISNMEWGKIISVGIVIGGVIGMALPINTFVSIDQVINFRTFSLYMLLVNAMLGAVFIESYADIIKNHKNNQTENHSKKDQK